MGDRHGKAFLCLQFHKESLETASPKSIQSNESTADPYSNTRGKGGKLSYWIAELIHWLKPFSLLAPQSKWENSALENRPDAPPETALEQRTARKKLGHHFYLSSHVHWQYSECFIHLDTHALEWRHYEDCSQSAGIEKLNWRNHPQDHYKREQWIWQFKVSLNSI